MAVRPASGVHSAFLLTDAVEGTRGLGRELIVDAVLLDGDPVERLVEQSKDAELLVVGNHGGRGRFFLRSVPASLAAGAACPTVVVRGEHPPEPTDPVVLGVDGTAASEPALAFGFAAADRWDVPLLAVHVCHDVLDDPEWPPLVEETDADDEALLAERLAGWGARYTDVEVLGELPDDRPARALVERSAHARLVVVGARPRRARGAGSHPRSAGPSCTGRTARWPWCGPTVTSGETAPDTGASCGRTR